MAQHKNNNKSVIMKKLNSSLLWLGLMAFAASAGATEYRIQYGVPFNIPTTWSTVDPLLSSWTNSGDQYGCSNWSPSVDTIESGVSFVQTASDCKQDQIRTVTPRQKNSRTGAIKALTAQSTVETQAIAETQTRSAVGTKIIGSKINAFSASGSALVNETSTLLWEGVNIAQYKLKSNSGVSGIPTTDTDMGTQTRKTITPTQAGDYTYTLTAIGTDGKTNVSSLNLSVKAADVHGLQNLNLPNTAPVASNMVNGVGYSGSVEGMPGGEATQIGLLIATYANQSDGTITVRACVSSGCASGSAPASQDGDNTWININFDEPLKINAGETMTYRYVQTKATRSLAIYTYTYTTPGSATSASRISGMYFPWLTMKFK
jgi:hypothetical protein